MRLELADDFQIITVIAGSLHQALGIGILQVFPPQAEEQGAVFELGHELLDAAQQGLDGLALRVGGEGQFGKGIKFMGNARDLFAVFHDFEKTAHRQIGCELRAQFFETGHLLFEIFKSSFQFRAVYAGKQILQTPGRWLISHSFPHQ